MAVLALLVFASVLPDLSAAIPRQTYYFRDFSIAFYPLRLFAARELREGRWPFWNPFVHEGSFALPGFYPLDLLHVLWSGPAAVSWLLCLHFPLAALASYALARDQGASRTGAYVSGAAYSLGGLALSSLNLYVFLQALALAPLVVLTLRRAALYGGRWIPAAALALSVSVSTLALEFVGQGLLLGIALGLAACPQRGAALRLVFAVCLGLGLSALPLATTMGILAESVRGGGFPADVALGNPVHPAAFLQVLVPGLFGALDSPAELWWGGGFFTKGFPYFLSLYLGPLALALAWVGISSLSGPRRLVLLGGAGFGLWYALGAWGGLAPLVAPWPFVRWVRFPSKTLLLPYIVVCLLAGLGADRLQGGQGWKGFRQAAWLAIAITTTLAAAVLIVPAKVVAWAGTPFPAAVVARFVARDCLLATGLALAGAILAIAVRRQRVEAGRAVVLIAALVVFDLARAGAGMNPQAPIAFFERLPEMKAQRLDDLGGGRVFSYGLDYSPAFRAFLAQGGPGLGLRSFFVSRQILAPYTNILDRVETAEGKDLTAFIPRPSELAPEDYDPGAIKGVLGRLRNAAVSRVLSLDPLVDPDLRLRTSIPAGPSALQIHVYELVKPWPRFYVGCRVLVAEDEGEAMDLPLRQGFNPARDVVLEEAGTAACQQARVHLRGRVPGEDRYEVESDGPGYLVTRDSFARGWKATVDGRTEWVQRANGRHRAVGIPAGRHIVVLRYQPPGFRLGILVTLLAAAATAALAVRPVLTSAE